MHEALRFKVQTLLGSLLQRTLGVFHNGLQSRAFLLGSLLSLLRKGLAQAPLVEQHSRRLGSADAEEEKVYRGQAGARNEVLACSHVNAT